MLFSIIICTRDRANDLRKTLHSLGTVTIPSGCTCELLIVDNASKDDTPRVAESAALPNMVVRPLHEPKPGQSNARNLGLSRARGEVIIFTGDDLRYPHQLLEAGYELAAVPLWTEHHFPIERLTRAGFLSHAKRLGMSGAYTAHHWEHQDLSTARLHLIKKIIQLAIWRAAHKADVQTSEGMHPSEMHHLRSLHIFGAALREQRRPRNYERHGLQKMRG